MFGKIVGFVGAALAPKNVELFLMHMITDPIKAHIDGLGSFLFDGVIGNTSGCAIISLNRGGRL